MPKQKWTKEEDQILTDCYAKGIYPIDIPINRTVAAKKTRAHSLGLILNIFWTEEEIQILKEKYGKIPTEELGINKARDKIVDKAYQLGLCKKINPWTIEELEILKSDYHTKKATELGLNHSMACIHNKARELGIATKVGDLTHDEHAFGRITLESCYWAGTFAGDGTC